MPIDEKVNLRQQLDFAVVVRRGTSDARGGARAGGDEALGGELVGHLNHVEGARDHDEALRMDPAFVDGMTPAQFGEAKMDLSI